MVLLVAVEVVAVVQRIIFLIRVVDDAFAEPAARTAARRATLLRAVAKNKKTRKQTQFWAKRAFALRVHSLFTAALWTTRRRSQTTAPSR